MKSLKVVLAILLVVCLVMGLAACEPATPPPAPSTSTSTSTPPPTTPVVTPTPTTSSPSKPAHNIDWQPGGGSTKSVDADKVGELTGTGTYNVNEVTAADNLTITNYDFSGKLVFNSISATGKNVVIDMPNATVEFSKEVTATALNVHASENTTIINANINAKLTIESGNLVVDSGTITEIDIPTTNATITKVVVNGGILTKITPQKALSIVVEKQATVNVAPTAPVTVEIKNAGAVIDLNLTNSSAKATIVPTVLPTAKINLSAAHGTAAAVTIEKTPAVQEAVTDDIIKSADGVTATLPDSITTVIESVYTIPFFADKAAFDAVFTGSSIAYNTNTSWDISKLSTLTQAQAQEIVTKYNNGESFEYAAYSRFIKYEHADLKSGDGAITIASIYGYKNGIKLNDDLASDGAYEGQTKADWYQFTAVAEKGTIYLRDDLMFIIKSLGIWVVNPTAERHYDITLSNGDIHRIKLVMPNQSNFKINPPEGGAVTVTTEATFIEALKNTSVKKITVDGDITLTQNVNLTKELVINTGKVLTIAADKTLTNNATIGNKGTITLTGTLTNNGTITGNGFYGANDAASFEKAFALGDVKLLGNITLTENIAIAKDIVIDLGEFSINKPITITAGIVEISNGTINNITDSLDPIIDVTGSATVTIDGITSTALAKRAVRASAGTLYVYNSSFTMGNAANAPTAVQVLGTANLAEFINNTITNATSSAPGWAGTGLLIWGKATADESKIFGNKFVGCQLGIAYSDYNNIAEDKWLNSTASLPTAAEYAAMSGAFVAESEVGNTFNMENSWDKIRVSIEANSLADIITINDITENAVTTIFLKANVEINEAIALAKRLVVTSDNTLTINNDMLTIAESSIGKIVANPGSTVYVPTALAGNVEGEGTITTIAPPSITDEIAVENNKFTVTIVKGTFDFESIEIDSHFLDAADQTITKESAAVELDFRIGKSGTSIADAITASNSAYAGIISISQDIAGNGDLALTFEILDYTAFVAAMKTKYTLTDFAPAKMHIYVVGKDAKGYTSGHMGGPELGEPTAKQADVTLVAPAPESVVA